MNIFRKWLQRHKRKVQKNPEEPAERIRKENPYLPCIRPILENILKQWELEYKNMRLILIDSDTEPESLLDEDDAESVLGQLSADLNFLLILTQRPAYFKKYVETMYEENGLLVNLEEKGSRRRFDANTVLDMEQKGSLWNLKLTEPFIYLPIYKKIWETTENLDICIPIGYNTVIVKGIRALEKEEGCYNRNGEEKYFDL